jgi:ABC-2 type transport system ATP-binding protein
VIEVDHLSKVYGERRAVDDISFTVGKGEVLGFLGPNGAGKTTTMRMLTCYMPATEGTARIAGYDIFEQSVEVRKRIGYLPENPPLYPDMTVDGYLNFVARIKGTPSSRRGGQVGDAIEKCDLGEVRNRIIGRLSKGYRQRVGLAQALLNNPEVLILDEPTIGLDPKQIHEVRTLIKSLASAHTIILSTHILPEVSMTCTRVVIIKKGKVVAMDTPEGLASQMKRAERVSLTVAGPVDAVRAKLSGIDGVLGVQAEDADVPYSNYIVECKLGTDLRRVLSAAVVGEGWGLLDIRLVSMSLEDVFIDLITNEREEGATAPAAEGGTHGGGDAGDAGAGEAKGEE